MKAKILLTGLVAPVMFAACTSEEALVPQSQQGETQIDLSNRPTLGKLELNFGSQTRATLDADGAFNAIEWLPGDAIGARVIDKVGGGKKDSHKIFYPILGYGITDWASTNYKYEKGESNTWATEALMIEGNYMFYFPYNTAALNRDALQLHFPIVQNINPASENVSETGANKDAVKEFIESDMTSIVGYAFLSAKDQSPVIKPEMNHVYAYPQITLVNNFAWDHDNDSETEDKAETLTIDSLLVESSNICEYYTANHQKIQNAFFPGTAKIEKQKVDGVEYAEYPAQTAGNWTTGKETAFLKYERTSSLVDKNEGVKGAKNGQIKVRFTEPLVLANKGKFSFHLVMPGQEYSVDALTIKLFLADGKELVISDSKTYSAANSKVVTYAPGKRYPMEEYNFTTSGTTNLKSSKGTLATFNITTGKIQDITPEKLTISTLDKFEDILKGAISNKETIEEGRHFELEQNAETGRAYLEFTPELIAKVKEYLKDGKVKFKSHMTVKGDNIEIDGNMFPEFGAITQESGKVTLKNSVNIKGNATFKGAADLNGVTIAGTATFNGATNINSGAKINGNVVVAAGTTNVNEATIKGQVEVKGTAVLKKIAESTTLTVNGGNATIARDGGKSNQNYNPAFTTVNVNSGSLTVNSNAFAIGTKTVTLGSLKNAGDPSKGTNQGTLNIGADATADLTNVNIIDAKIKVDGTASFADDFSYDKGSIENNGTINIAAEKTLTIAEGVSFTNKNTVNGAIENNGTIYNHADLTVAENNGTIEAATSISKTIVNGGEGTIDNDNKAYLSVKSGVKQTVFYTFTGAVGVDDIEGLNTQLYSINKVIFKGAVTLDNAISADAFYGVETLDLHANLNLSANVTIANIKAINVKENVSFVGWGNNIYTLTDNADCTVTVDAGKVFTIKDATFAGTKLTFVGNEYVCESDHTDHSGDPKQGKLVITNGTVNCGQDAATAVAGIVFGGTKEGNLLK